VPFVDQEPDPHHVREDDEESRQIIAIRGLTAAAGSIIQDINYGDIQFPAYCSFGIVHRTAVKIVTSF
jgi:hypothetical protein